ncbi:MAG: hypothetical protein U0586_05045 [Candidatus Brocadiaceae bacterium]
MSPKTGNHYYKISQGWRGFRRYFLFGNHKFNDIAVQKMRAIDAVLVPDDMK